MSELILSKKMRFFQNLSLFAFMAMVLAGCGTLGSKENLPDNGSGGAAPKSGLLLQTGDLLKIDFSGPTNPPQSHEEHIKEDGTISLYLVGSVKAVGKTTGDLQKEIQGLYVPNYYKNLNVTVRVGDQLYYVGGEVRNGGRQPYLGPVTVLGAIKAAGDFTDFANRKKVQVIRADGSSRTVDCVKALKNPQLDLPVYPGDRIDVPARRI